MNSKEQEGLDYKKTLLKLIETGKLNLRDLNGNTIELSDGEEEESNSENEPAEREKEKEKEEEEKEEKKDDENFQAKFLEMKKKLDEFPNIIAKLNTELRMMTKGTPVVAALQSRNSDLDAFIWKFNISFDWDNKNIRLPISLVDDIKILNAALTDEIIYHDIVSFDST